VHSSLRLAAACLTASSLGLLVEAPAGARPPDLPHTAHGQQAIRLLGDQLDEAAALNGWSAAKLRDVLRTDPTAWVDTDGRVFYVEPVATANGPSSIGEGVAPYPLGDTFLLHSRPSSTHVIYLDFDGAMVSGTAWNANGLPNGSYVGYELDGTAAFSDTEKEEIQKVWQRVVEDYAPFDVDVTTEDPGAAAIDRTSASDQNFGTRALISDDSAASAALCSNSCGGIAYIGVFDLPGTGVFGHAYYQPAWVFGHQLASNDTKDIAEAVSHEVGHNFGLSHDSTSVLTYYGGHNMWAPIMGVGYQRPVVQWSRGEYADAQNPEDDLGIIAGGGAPVIADDAGGTLLTASTNTSGTKLITAPDDQDVYVLGSCSGPMTIAAAPPAPATPSPNLDVQLDLLDSAGSVVASANPPSAYVSRDVASGLSATLSTTVAAGSYYLRVDGVGTGDPTTGYSDYDSLGAYSLAITASCSPGAGPPGAPRSLSAVGNGPGHSAQVSWNTPADIGSGPVTSYTVFLDGAPVGTTTTPGATLSGLVLGRAYDVAVSATNATGTGPQAHLSLTVTDRPSAPTITRARSGKKGGRRTISVAWSPPADTGGLPITGYQVLVLKRGALVRLVDVGAGQTSYVVKIRARKYRFVVQAVNAVGAGPRSALSRAVRAR
jgi:hypothetical protein